jgi:S-DNA-T family DNA segregation ATPase FtsK/SpoIIIE
VLPPCEVADPFAVGVVDDPAAQRRVPLRWAATANLLLIGSLGAGTTTAAIALAAAFLRGGTADERHLYVVDGNGDARLDAFTGVAHCGGVVRTGEAERLDRLLRRLTGEIDRRTVGGERGARVLVVLDGVAAVRTALGSAAYAEAATRLDRVLREGPAVGIVTCATTDGSSPGALAAVPGERWMFRVDDPSVAMALGVVARVEVSGRLVVVEHGLVAQVVHDPDAAARLPRRVHRSGPAPLDVLPARLDPDVLPRSTGDARSRVLTVGWGAADLTVEHLDVPAGDHVFIGGGSRSGRSTALDRIVDAWREVHPDVEVVIVGRPGLGSDPLPVSVPVLVVVDDADRVADPDGRLAAIAAGRSGEVTLVAAARIESVRAAYGHWLREVTRSQCGLLLTSSGEVDGDLLGATLPRRSPIPARPGLAWLVDRHGPRLAQVAARMPA